MTDLRPSDPAGPATTRRRRGRSFSYAYADGRAVKNRRTLRRIKALVLPPAWRDVWICRDPDGHIQAVGTDAAGRRQYRYHDVLRYEQDGAWIDVKSDDINAYLRDRFETEVSAKDFRTWHATVHAAVGLAVSRRVRTRTGRRKAITRVMKEVADHLGNTPAVARASYVDPRVITAYEKGKTIERALTDLGAGDGPATHGAAERAVVALLKRTPNQGAPTSAAPSGQRPPADPRPRSRLRRPPPRGPTSPVARAWARRCVRERHRAAASPGATRPRPARPGACLHGRCRADGSGYGS
ncbi:hypothetical protein Acor_57280 [Acrocarpospora corrugata]|uniref:Uncharacterized protein n=1 Tax=Acrocarpospora corrugata TaxID=35763 RepID=A0A5M3W6U8_9ACTN|nr:hypothetical protein [Acrocarpospora corrugata]GES03662.1 hypothetical protein Acor_57280 [Acrocarpospora corrugata]